MGFFKDRSAVSPVIGTLLILATFTVVVSTVILVGRPQIVDYQERGEFQTVVNQMGQVVSHTSQLAISGNTNEVRHPTLKLPNGQFQVGQGHFVAVSVGYMGTDYNSVAGQDVEAWKHASFYIEAADARPSGPDFRPFWDANDQAVQVVYQDKRYTGGALGEREMYLKIHQWVGGDWVETLDSRAFLGGTQQMQDGEGFDVVPFDASMSTLAAGPWKIEAWGVPGLGDHVLAGEIFLYDQTQMQYHYSGESGPRHAFAENGGLFVYEHNQYRLVRPGLVAAPEDNKGGNMLNVRAATIATDSASASGRTDLGFLMRVSDTEGWVSRGGAAVTRIQMSGPFEDLWHQNMDQRGYVADADPERGVYHVDGTTTAGRHTAYPVNLMWSEISMKVRTK